MNLRFLAGRAGSVSAGASILGSWQVCHNLCLALIALLGVMGVTLTGMPFLFLTRLAIPLWSVAVVLFAVVVYLYFKKRCVSQSLLIINAGLIIAGTPFFTAVQWVFWVVGGGIVIFGVIRYFTMKHRCKHE